MAIRPSPKSKPPPPLEVDRRNEVFVSDDKRVIPRYLNFGHPPRIRAIFRRLMRIPERQVAGLLEEVHGAFRSRHRDLDETIESSFTSAARHVRSVPEMSEQRRMLIGAYFTMEYSIESAALFNPSIVPHPDQSDVPAGSVRFLLSLRATGEGHLSSIVFRRGVIDSAGHLSFDPPPRWAVTCRPQADQAFHKELFGRKLRSSETPCELCQDVLDLLDDPFTAAQLKAAIQQVRARPGTPEPFRALAAEMLWIARANYTLSFPEDCLPAEIVIFPATSYEARGMEDLRLCRFRDEEGWGHYYGTYTAYDGHRTHPMLLETADFETFHVSTLSGRYVKNKGMALFPRKVGGYYLMLARHDGENNFLLRSHNLYVWNVSQRLQSPREPWELTQVGNCGSPLETEAGWLVLTHGVGPVRRYSIGALLLDREDPGKVIGRLRQPLLAPREEEREGYVPNVVYSCGSMIHGRDLVIPYAVSDSRTSFATVSVPDLLARLKAEGK